MGMTTIKCSAFVKRQTPDSGFSHFTGTWEELEYAVCDAINRKKGNSIEPGYRDGVIIVHIPPWQFRSAIIRLNKDSDLVAAYAARQEGEDTYVRMSVKSDKQMANYASVVLYRSDVLAENNSRSTDADWEIICIRARAEEEEDPIHPVSMARNFLQLKGGTAGDFTAEQFAKSIIYWSNHAMCAKRTTLDKIYDWFNGN